MKIIETLLGNSNNNRTVTIEIKNDDESMITGVQLYQYVKKVNSPLPYIITGMQYIRSDDYGWIDIYPASIRGVLDQLYIKDDWLFAKRVRLRFEEP